MDEVIFSKFCCQRSKKYQIQTMVMREDGKKTVVKKAVYPEAAPHVMNLTENQKALEKIFEGNERIGVCGCGKKSENEVVFDFVDGVSLDSIMEEIFERKETEDIIASLKEFLDLLLVMATDRSWYMTDAFAEVFGRVKLDDNQVCGNICNIDMVFSNIIKAEKYYITDYEWVFHFPIPISYIFYRSLFCSCGFSKLDEPIKQKIWEYFGIDEKKRDIYLEMEKNFQRYVAGQEFAVNRIIEKKPYAAVEFKRVPWEACGHVIRVFDMDDGRKKQIYAQDNSDSQVDFCLDMRKHKAVCKLGIGFVPKNSMVIIDKVAGKTEGEEQWLTYKHNAALKIKGSLCFTDNEPMLYVDNKQFDFLVLEYRILEQQDRLVEETADAVRGRWNPRKMAVRLKRRCRGLKKYKIFRQYFASR